MSCLNCVRTWYPKLISTFPLYVLLLDHSNEVFLEKNIEKGPAKISLHRIIFLPVSRLQYFRNSVLITKYTGTYIQKKIPLSLERLKRISPISNTYYYTVSTNRIPVSCLNCVRTRNLEL